MRRKLELLSLLAAAALALAGLAAGGAIAQPTAVATTPSGATANVDRNVYSAGGDVRTTAPVRGDFSATGGLVIVDQPVAGDASLAGGSVEVRAPIGVDLRVAGGDVRIASMVGGDLFVVGGNVILSPEALVAHDASLHASKISIEGRIDGDLHANADRIVINGEVRGDVRVHASRVELGPKARIGGALHYVADGELAKAEGATVLGTTTREERMWTRSRERHVPADRLARGFRWIGGVAAYLAVLAAAALFLLAAPLFGAGAAQRVRATPWTALGLGLATLLAAPVLAVLLFITLLGIPLALTVLALYPAVLLLGFVVSVLFIARVLPPAFRLPAPQAFGATLGWFAAALLLVMVVARIPFLG
ncbi:MAG: polymer-forming cytoskeletal family protein, partial [Ramlibacter sp.]|nr:polymer-forming cytoskeletal family protein [Ramlibacter sp.]